MNRATPHRATHPAHPPLVFDHLVIAVEDLAKALDTVDDLGFRARRGGVHSNRATENALIGLQNQQYIELLALTREEPLPTAIDFGALFTDQMTSGAVGFALRTDNLERDAERLTARGVRVGTIVDGERQREDGERVRWRLALIEDGFTPFLIQDVTPIELRLPAPKHARHVNGVQSIVGIELFEPSAERPPLYDALFGEPRFVVSGEGLGVAVYVLRDGVRVIVTHAEPYAPTGSSRLDPYEQQMNALDDLHALTSLLPYERFVRRTHKLLNRLLPRWRKARRALRGDLAERHALARERDGRFIASVHLHSERNIDALTRDPAALDVRFLARPSASPPPMAVRWRGSEGEVRVFGDHSEYEPDAYTLEPPDEPDDPPDDALMPDEATAPDLFVVPELHDHAQPAVAARGVPAADPTLPDDETSALASIGYLRDEALVSGDDDDTPDAAADGDTPSDADARPDDRTTG